MSSSSSTTRFRSLIAVLGLVAAAPLVAACGGPDASQAAESSASIPADTVVIDVRTPEEFAEQHLDGALNIDIRAADFVQRLESLDRNTPYAVYCRSGNRSAQAVQAMKDLGFTSVSDHGSVAQASASLGIDIVS